jgi:hypothetical protein
MSVTTDTVSLAQISQYLWDDAISNQSQLFGGSIDVGRAKKLYMERKALEYGNAQSLPNLNSATTYVYSMCGGMVNLASLIFGNGNGGGSVISGSTSGLYSVLEFSQNAVLNATSIIFVSAIGKRLIAASRGGHDVGSILTGGLPTGNQVFWDISTGTLTVSSTQPFYDQEFIRIIVQ